MPSSESDMVSVDSDIDAVIIDYDDVSNYNPEQILPESPENIQKIRSWLQPTAYAITGGEYRKHLDSHVAGTGGWLTSSATYQQWLTGSGNGLLWIKGIPGSGKSVIAANLIHEIAKSNPGSPVLFFFFRQIIDANHKPKALLQDWLDQVLEYSPPLQRHLWECLKDRQSIERITIKEMWRLLYMAFAGLPKKGFCIVDALDEMDQGHDAFLEALGALGQWQPEKVKVLITSRPVPSVEGQLRQVPCLHIRLRESLVDVDIATYVQVALSNSAIPQRDWQVITDAVPGQANGLFIYAKLAMDAFLQQGADINAVLSQLPTDLNVLYTGLLREHAKRSGVPLPIQHMILQAVTHATRPLRLLELAEMVKVYTSDGFMRDLKATKDLIRSACGPLLEILIDETVSVIHHSFTEYLKGSTRSEDDSGYPCLQMGSSHAQLALACLHYLQAGCLNDVRITIKDDSDEPIPDPLSDSTNSLPKSEVQLRLKYPFFEYATSNWHHHVNRAEVAGYDQTQVNMALRKFLGNGKNIKAWLQLKWPCGLVTQLHIAARKGLVSYAKELIGTAAVDVPDVSGKTPLWWAADGGHSEIIKALIAAGANPNHDDTTYGLKPLHLVARSNHYKAAKVLLEAGVDPKAKKTRANPRTSVFACGSSRSTIGEMALMYACHKGHLETVEMFLPFLQNIDSVHEALHWAAEKGHGKIVAKILEHPGVDVNVTICGNTALYVACGSWDVATVTALLKAGADPNITCAGCGLDWGPWMGDGNKLNCLLPLREGWSGMNAEPDKVKAIFSLLVEAGIDINHRTKQGRTPLHYAAESPILARLLVDAGADANVADPSGSTPLHEVRSLDCMVLLVEQGNANINIVRADGRTPLLCLLSRCDTDTILRFLEYKPDCNLLDNKGNGVLHVLLDDVSPKLRIVEALLKGGADPDLINQDGLTPLLCLSPYTSGLTKVVDLFLGAGADINAMDRDGAALLQQRISRAPSWGEDQKREVRDLIDRGASASIRDNHGRTCLHHAILSKGATEPNVAKFDSLVDLGFDIQAVDYRGNGLLHEFALRGKTGGSHHGELTIKLWKRLLALGLDVDLKNNTGRTPLHVLCAAHIPLRAYERASILAIDLLIERVKDINIADKDGITALHIAATGGELYAKKLLDAGADPTAATHERLTPLHIASRCRESNIVGLLLDALRKRNQEPTLTEPVIGVNAKASSSEGDITPLFYACRSGRQESVALLLEAGADVNIGTIFRAFDRFDEEDDLWKSRADFFDHDGNGGAIALRVDDTLRHKAAPPDSRPYMMVANQTTRPDEIFRMLVEYGADLSQFNADSVTASVRDGPMSTFCKFLDPSIREASINAVRDLEIMKPGMSKEIFGRFLSRWEFHLVEQLARLGISFLPTPGNDEHCKLAILVNHGFASLVEAIGTIEADRNLEQGDWCAFGDATRPGLFFAGRDVSNPIHVGRNTMPFLLHAVRREIPNMTVVRLLVDKFGVDINELHYTWEFVNGTSQVSPSDSVVHSVSQGKSWWHVHQALPFLLSVGADVDVRNYKGQTPLHLALEACSHPFSPYSDVAVRTLIAAGADVCAVDNGGKSCFGYAQNDVNMVRLLRSHGATVTADAVFGAVESQNVDLLRIFFSEGVDANIRRHKLAKESSVNNRERGSEIEKLEPYGAFPLYLAAQGLHSDSDLSPMDIEALGNVIEMVQVLLDHGADPFAKFLQGGRERTVLHELLLAGGMVDQFLDIPKLDVNHRDAKGRTLLHAACHGYHGLDHVIGSHKDHANKKGYVTVFQRLISLGAKVEARDDFGRNVLHYMVGIAQDNEFHHFEKAFTSVIHKTPSLIDQADEDGMTPLHYAVDRAVKSRDSQAVLFLLLFGANHLAETNTGDTVLHLLSRNLDAVKLRELFQDFVRRGVDVNVRNRRGETPLFAFCSRLKSPRSYTPSIWDTESDDESEKYTEEGAGRMLQALGADFSARDDRGRGLMHVAASGEVGRFRELMDMGLDVMMEDDAQQTAIDVAAASENRDVLELFEKKD
ncbi:ankyrin repeat-containing domain protein [Dactylonectria estremocensis]|uniref:Ankyrin repeat-containing domain protein n=1 Tax=Dactylonectria estremocensis TaxID=1079267 RepID=A0A9P9J859_9HYPO|nr:ankyrin repeat-containing domain protein [Dactylonectria estremocensis]